MSVYWSSWFSDPHFKESKKILMNIIADIDQTNLYIPPSSAINCCVSRYEYILNLAFSAVVTSVTADPPIIDPNPLDPGPTLFSYNYT